MIVSASYRTDIPAFFADWFRARLADRYCDVKNPYGGKPYRVALRGDGVDGYVFWTRNAAPFGAALDDVAALGLASVIQFTVTGYPRALDAHTIRPVQAAAQIVELAHRFGPRAVVWRYDPVVFSSITPPDWHLDNFGHLAQKLAGSVDECVISFANIYKKTRKRLNMAGQTHDFLWYDPNWEEKRQLLSELCEISDANSIRLTVCSQKDALTDDIEAARCIDPMRLSDLAGRDIAGRIKGNRPDCLCAESRDIGAYDTCAHGCAYCYAVSDHEKAAAGLRG